MNLDSYPLWTALVTPLQESGEVDYPSLKRLLKEQEEAGNGVLILGSTGEALNLESDEKKNILDFTLKQNLKVPLMVGVGGVNLKDTLDWVAWVVAAAATKGGSGGVHSYLMVTPLYARPGAEGQYEWFKALLDRAHGPCVLYNVPSRTGVSLSWEAVERLREHPRFWGIKEASGSVDHFQRYGEAALSAKLFSGDDAMLPECVPYGANGLISVASNVWPRATQLYVRQALKSTLPETSVWKDAIETLFIASNPVPVKALLKDKGRISSAKMRAPLSEKDLPELDLLRKADESIAQWLKAYN